MSRGSLSLAFCGLWFCYGLPEDLRDLTSVDMIIRRSTGRTQEEDTNQAFLAVERNCAEPTCEATLAFLLAAGDGEELISEEVQSGGTAIWVGLKAPQDESLGLQWHGLWDLWVDLKHAHLETEEPHSELCTEAYRMLEWKPFAEHLWTSEMSCSWGLILVREQTV